MAFIAPYFTYANLLPPLFLIISLALSFHLAYISIANSFSCLS